MLSILLSAVECEEDGILLTEIYKEYKRTLFAIAREFLIDKSLAEDCVQQTFLDLIKYIDSFKKIDLNNRRAYIASVCKYAAYRINNTGQKELEYELYDDNIALSQMSHNYGFSEFDRFVVADAVNSLDDKYREPFILRYSGGLSVNEISEKLGITPNLVSQRLCRAVKKLYELLKEE